MEVRQICKDYFDVFKEIVNYKNNDNKINALAALKILSWFTLIIPIGFATTYLIDSLYRRITKKEHLSPRDKKVEHQRQKNLIKGKDKDTDKVKDFIPETTLKDTEVVPETLLKEEEKVVSEITSKIDSVESPKLEFSEVLSVYQPMYAPQENRQNLQEYSQSLDYQRHAKTARIYYHSSQLAEDDALRIIFQREPTNIGMDQLYDKKKLNELFGYQSSVYNDVSIRKADGSLFKDLPNTAAVYSETYLWDPVGGKGKKEIACLSLPAPALDSPKQPHYNYYVKGDKLDAEKYEQEMGVLFKCIEKTIRDNKVTAFGNKGINRVVLSKFGQNAFLKALKPKSRMIAQQIYRTQMAIFLHNIEDINLEIVMSEFVFNPKFHEKWHDNIIIGDITEVAQERDLIINAWDPHSAPGNGNDTDFSFDGAMGKSTGILLTQTSWFNETLKSKNSLVAFS